MKLNKKKDYKQETMFIAFGLFDRYVFRIITASSQFPIKVDLVILATSCLILAAKLNEPLNPSVKKTLKLLEDSHSEDPDTYKQPLIDLEFNIVFTL